MIFDWGSAAAAKEAAEAAKEAAAAANKAAEAATEAAKANQEASLSVPFFRTPEELVMFAVTQIVTELTTTNSHPIYQSIKADLRQLATKNIQDISYLGLHP